MLEQRYGRAVDWWAFGVLMYEMLLGQSPFRGDDEDEIFDAILEDEPLYPITMPRDAVSILQKVMSSNKLLQFFNILITLSAIFLSLFQSSSHFSFLLVILRDDSALARLTQRRSKDIRSSRT